MTEYHYYVELLGLSYYELVQKLIQKYGEVTDDYFKEKSYLRFLNKEIKNPTKGKYSKASEGLYCHHVLENQYENLGNLEYIHYFNYSFELQKKEKLVYCDLIEHLILHVLIMKETEGRFGSNGFKSFIRPTVVDWYIKRQNKPKRLWLVAVYDRSFLFKDEAIQLLETIDHILLTYARDTIEERFNHEQLIKEMEVREALEKEKVFYSIYPNLKLSQITYHTARRDIVKTLYSLDCKNRELPFKKYYLSLNQFNREELLMRLNDFFQKTEKL